MIIIRLLLTAVLVVAAILGLRYVWVSYFEAPWTRDAHIRADVVEVSSYVPGEIVTLYVSENEYVKAGDPLLEIDRSGYEIALAQAEANLDQAVAQEDLEDQQAARLVALAQENSAAVSEVEVANQRLQAASAQAARQAAEQAAAEARLRLERTIVPARVSGWVTNLTADEGDFVSEGSAITAIVDAESFRVDAYFMETKLPAVAEGASARIRLMSSGAVLEGRVQGIARGIYRPGTQPNQVLESPEPSFQWIRLAQRIPVRIDIVETSRDTPLVAGQTASVLIETPGQDGILSQIGTDLTAFWARFQ